MTKVKMTTNHKIGLGIAALLTLTSWAIVIYYWPKLPTIIPTHFGVSGQPDDWSVKSFWSVGLLPIIQSFILLLFSFIYYHPQYMNLPSTLWLMTLDGEKRERAFTLMRNLLVGTQLWVGVLFTYIAYSMNKSALTANDGLNPWIMLGIIVGMLGWLIYNSVKINTIIVSQINQAKGK